MARTQRVTGVSLGEWRKPLNQHHDLRRIMHVVAPAEMGGLERVVQALTIGLSVAGYEAHLAAVLDEGHPQHWLVTAAQVAGVVTHPIVLRARAYHAERRAIADLCRRVRPDVVHTHGYRPDVVDAGVARAEGIPIVSTAHGFAGGGWKNRVYEGLQRRALRRFDAVIAVSRALAAQLAQRGVPARRIHVVPNAWHEPGTPLDRAAARRVLGLAERSFVIGWVGRLSFEKGLDVLVDALPHLSDLTFGVSIVGAGPSRTACEERARANGAAGRLVWHGLVPDAASLFAAFDAFVLSSRTEGAPIALFEAMAARVPIVATCVGGVPDVVSPAEAMLVPADNPRVLADALRSVQGDPAGARARASRAHERLGGEFGAAAWLRRHEAIYDLVRSGVPQAVAS